MHLNSNGIIFYNDKIYQENYTTRQFNNCCNLIILRAFPVQRFIDRHVNILPTYNLCVLKYAKTHFIYKPSNCFNNTFGEFLSIYINTSNTNNNYRSWNITLFRAPNNIWGL